VTRSDQSSDVLSVISHSTKAATAFRMTGRSCGPGCG